jgi:hypothetical protein
MNNQAYTSTAKMWWQKNSGRLGSELNWDTFCEIWMASINSEDQKTENVHTETSDERLKKELKMFLTHTGRSIDEKADTRTN